MAIVHSPRAATTFVAILAVAAFGVFIVLSGEQESRGASGEPAMAEQDSSESVDRLDGESNREFSARDLFEPEAIAELPQEVDEPAIEAPATSSKDPYGPSAYPIHTPAAGAPIAPDAWATIGPLERTPVPDAVFDEKYPPDTTEGTLMGTAQVLEREVNLSLLELSPQMLSARHFEEVLLPRDESGTANLSFYLGLRGDHGLPRHAYWDAMEGEGTPLKVVWFPFDQYPELYDKLDEVDYLRRRLATSGF